MRDASEIWRLFRVYIVHMCNFCERYTVRAPSLPCSSLTAIFSAFDCIRSFSYIFWYIYFTSLFLPERLFDFPPSLFPQRVPIVVVPVRCYPPGPTTRTIQRRLVAPPASFCLCHGFTRSSRWPQCYYGYALSHKSVFWARIAVMHV